jgi:hypothetical protein
MNPDRGGADGLRAGHRAEPARPPPPGGRGGRGGAAAGGPAGVLSADLRQRDGQGARPREGRRGPAAGFPARDGARCKVWLVGGSIPLEASLPEKVRNSCLVYDDDGRRVARYDKIHLFGFTRGTERLQRKSDHRGRRRGSSPFRFPRRPRRLVDLLRPALSRTVSAPWARWTCWWCRRPSPTPPARPTGSCCCARARWRTSAMCWLRPRAAPTRADGDLGRQHGGRPLGRGARPSADKGPAW